MDVKKSVNNLYANGYIINMSDGELYLFRNLIEYKGTEKDIYHIVAEGDLPDQLAWRYYGKYTENAAKLWYIICDVNNIIDPFRDFPDLIGTTILIPDYFNIRLLTQ